MEFDRLGHVADLEILARRHTYVTAEVQSFERPRVSGNLPTTRLRRPGAKQALAAQRKCVFESAILRIGRDSFRCGLHHFELGAHFLDLRRLLFQLGRESL